MSWIAVPRKIPAWTGEAAKKCAATHGYSNIAMQPNSTTQVTAKAVSACFARMTGDIATTAVQPQTAADLVPVLFRRELDVQQRFFAMGEAIAHLNHLWHAGRLERTIAADGTIRFGRA